MPAKPNYEFLKRQKEQAKQKKKEEKKLRKLQDQNEQGGLQDGASEDGPAQTPAD
jgi:hypothetical protein